jgi:transcriptional regulator with XRE-family HTH domain
MEEQGRTEKGLAEATGIPRTTLQRRLTGTSDFTVSELDALARHLGIPLVELLADEPAA